MKQLIEKNTKNILSRKELKGITGTGSGKRCKYACTFTLPNGNAGIYIYEGVACSTTNVCSNIAPCAERANGAAYSLTVSCS